MPSQSPSRDSLLFELRKNVYYRCDLDQELIKNKDKTDDECLAVLYLFFSGISCLVVPFKRKTKNLCVKPVMNCGDDVNKNSFLL